MKQLPISRDGFIFLLLFSFIYVFPLLISNVYYADDVTRAINGHYWDYDNRLISNAIMKTLSFNQKIKDFFPYTTIFSGLIFSLCGYLVSRILDLETNRTLKISSLLLLTSPFMIENLAFRYDSPFMAISVTAAILPFYGKLIESKTKFIISLIIAVLVIFLTYQASISIFIIMVLLIAVKNLYVDDLKKALFVFISAILAVIAGFIIYKFLLYITDSPSVGRDKFVFFSEDFVRIFNYNVTSVYNLVNQIFNPHYLFGIICTFLAFVYGIYNLFKQNIKTYNKLFIVLFLFLIPIIVPLPLIVLENTYINPRVMLGFPFIIYGMLFLINKYSQKLTTYISLYFVVIAFPLMSSFGNLLRDQDQFQSSIVNDVISKTDLNGKNLIIDGQVPWTNQSENLISGYEFINYLHTKFLGNQNFGLEEFFVLKSNNLYNISFPRDKTRDELLKNKMNIPIVNRTNYYNLRADGRNVILDFNKTDIFIPELINIELKPSENVAGNFDIVKPINEIYEIRGWGIIYGVNSTKNNLKLLLIGNTKTYASELSKEKRSDVSEAMDGPYNDSGFSSLINTQTMEKGVYTLGIIIENEGKKEILIKDNKIIVK